MILFEKFYDRLKLQVFGTGVKPVVLKRLTAKLSTPETDLTHLLTLWSGDDECKEVARFDQV
jgi:hypothetical protein